MGISNKDDQSEKIAVIDETGELFPLFETQMKTINQEIEIIKYTKTLQEAEKEVLAEEYEGVLILNLNQNQLPSANINH